jgi:hypothetical protein
MSEFGSSSDATFVENAFLSASLYTTFPDIITFHVNECDNASAAVENSIISTMNNASRDEAFEVSDSTDWLQTPLRSLAPVDSALRCQVCKDFYNTPMITSCSHTFCSICIRRCLSNDGRCPACRTQDQELKLRFNGAMEELVEAFKAARPEVLEHARKPSVVVADVPKRRREADVEEVESPPKKRTRSSARTTQSSQRVVVLDSDGEDEDYVPGEIFDELYPIFYANTAIFRRRIRALSHL